MAKKIKLTEKLKKAGVSKADVARINKIGKTITISVTPKKESGSSSSADRKRKALAPGKRLTTKGTVYTERRKNRSDKSRQKGV